MDVLPLAVSVAGNADPVVAPAISAGLGFEQVVRRIMLCSRCKQPKKGHICTWQEGDDFPAGTTRKRTADSSTIDPVSGLITSSGSPKQARVLQPHKKATAVDKKKKKDLLDFLSCNEKDYPVQNQDYLKDYLTMLTNMGDDEVRDPRLLQARVRQFAADQFERVDDPVLLTWKSTFPNVLIQAHDHESLRELDEECAAEDALVMTGTRSYSGKGKEVAD